MMQRKWPLMKSATVSLALALALAQLGVGMTSYAAQLEMEAGYTNVSLTRQNSKDEQDFTGLETASANISAFDWRGSLMIQESTKSSLSAGLEICALTQSFTFSTTQFVHKSVVGQYQYYLLGGPNHVESGSGELTAIQHFSNLVYLPIVTRYVGIDYLTPGTQGQQNFRGDLLTLELGLGAKVAVGRRSSLGVLVLRQLINIPVSEISISYSETSAFLTWNFETN